MGSIYARAGLISVRFKDATGKWVSRATGFKVGEEKQAKALLARVEEGVAKGEAVPGAPLSVEAYFKGWIKERRARGVPSADTEESRLERYIFPALGSVLLEDLSKKTVRSFVWSLRLLPSRAGGTLAPRTVRNVYAVLRQGLHEATVDDLIAVNPCVMKKGDLPPKVDKDPAWRSTAVFTRAEVECIVTDTRVPEDRRALYALSFLTGMRSGEAAMRRWRDWDKTTQPLGRMLVATSWSTASKTEKSTKTHRTREVPVHPTLVAILDEWRTNGWKRVLGREPCDEDLIVPSRLGKVRSVNFTLKRFYEDLERLGLRQRRQYDSRRTFISLAQADGASKDILRWVTHGPSGDIVDVYTTLPWATLCREVSKLNITLTPAEPPPDGDLVTVGVTESFGSGNRQEKGLQVRGLAALENWRGVRDSNPWPPA